MIQNWEKLYQILLKCQAPKQTPLVPLVNQQVISHNFHCPNKIISQPLLASPFIYCDFILTIGLRIGRSRFRPNLSIESTQRNRLRRISGSLGGPSEIVNSPLGLGNMARSHRVRTISNSSTTSETENTSQCVSAIPTTTVDGKTDSNIPHTPQRQAIVY